MPVMQVRFDFKRKAKALNSEGKKERKKKERRENKKEIKH